MAHTKPTAVPTSISTEAQTPLHLTEPNISDPTAATGAPWWQSLLDVTWKLALVVGLIYLVMRALAALKQRGFSPKRPLGNKGHKQQRHFFEQIEEMQLAPQHVLHAVRAGDRIFLIARTQGALRALGEVELSEVTGEEATTGASSSFADQMFRAWSGLANKQNESAPAHAAKAATSSTSIPMPNMHPKKTEEATPAFLTDGEEDVIDAKWVTVKPNVTPIMSLARITPETVAANTPLPLRRGTARDSELPPPPSEPLSESLEREILWYAEEHNDSAAAKKYGMTRQRVTAMRMRMERERLGRLLEEHRRERDVKLSQRPPVAAASMGKREERPISKAPLPTAPDHPRGNFAEAERTPVPIARGSAARTAYTQNTGSTPPAPSAKSVVKPDVAPTTNGPKSDAEEQAITVGQILAARFGIKIPATK